MSAPRQRPGETSGPGKVRAEASLLKADLAPDPIAQFRAWLEEALAAEPHEPTAMTLATSGLGGRPAARTVLLKGCDERGFVFYTNYGSRKARELADNPFAALVFYWPFLGRQVRVEGTVEKISREESAAYFATRPRTSQLGAWASRQSEPVAGRDDLERAFASLAERFAGVPVPLPDFWGGYRLRPDVVELWQQRDNRLHDRFIYRLVSGGAGGSGAEWRIERLSP
jgi:pyridoxamine 5'-phosphate oxidase